MSVDVDIDIDARYAEAVQLAEEGQPQFATYRALDVLRAQRDHAGALALLQGLGDTIDGRALAGFIDQLTDTAADRALAARLQQLQPAPLRTYDEPLVHDDADFEALRERLAALRRAGASGEAVFRYRAAFASFPSLTDSMHAVAQDPIPPPAGYRYPPRPTVEVRPPDPIEAEVRELLARGDRLRAIRLVVERTGVSLAQAKQRVDALA
ncbi:MAG TPA: hypothetical protein VFQ53_16720 [Kofleriaceae bacterium]|nr:hypothetical protein [Kofleriaceae bacterium]